MSSNSRRDAKRGSKKRSSNNQGKMPVSPPALDTTFAFGHTVRYLVSTAAITNCTVSPLQLANTLGVAVAATDLRSILREVRLKRVRIWSPAASGNTVSVEFPSNAATAFGSRSIIHSDTSLSSTFPARVSAKPAKNSLADMWFDIGSSVSTLFILTAPLGSIIDISFSFTLNDRLAAPASFTVAGATAGILYWPTQTPTGGTGTLVPVSLPTV